MGSIDDEENSSFSESKIKSKLSRQRIDFDRDLENELLDMKNMVIESDSISSKTVSDSS